MTSAAAWDRIEDRVCF